MPKYSISGWIILKTKRASPNKKQFKDAINSKQTLLKANRKPARSQKAFYIQKKYSLTFDELVFQQKSKNGLSSPELAELALELLFEKFQIPAK